jgi:hypothetical protein
LRDFVEFSPTMPENIDLKIMIKNQEVCAGDVNLFIRK